MGRKTNFDGIKLTIQIHRKSIRAIILATFSLLAASICDAVAADHSNVCEQEMIRSARENAIPVAVLYAVALTETGQQGELHEYAMNIGGRPVFNRTLSEALTTFAKARAEGTKLIDVGCMQVNHYFHGRNFSSVGEMFDPRKNVDYAARFLGSLHTSEKTWTGAVARYHAGPNNAAAQATYICAVIGNMVTSGFGSWTQESKQFCLQRTTMRPRRPEPRDGMPVREMSGAN